MNISQFHLATSSRIARAIVAVVLVGGGLGVSNTAVAQGVAEQVPNELKGVSIDQKMGDKLPLDLVFTDDKGKEVKLSDYFTGKNPVILTPVYYSCPQLCTLVLNGMVDGLNGIEMSAGTEFEIVTYSFKADESTELASRKKRAYLTQYTRENAADGWHFLTGSKESVDALSEAIGFNFKIQPNGEIAHSASIVFITPDGRISKYMNDVLFRPRDMRLALVDSSQGTISAPMDRFLLFTCFRYDPDAGGFVPSAWKIMRFFGGLTVIILGATLFVLFRMDSKKQLSIEGNPNTIAGSRLPVAEGGMQ